MRKIYALADYKGFFGSKWLANPYRSGFDKTILKSLLKELNWDIEFVRFQEVDFSQNWSGRLVVYTSSEEKDLLYKSYIEDIVLSLERAGAVLIPTFDFLRANNNKVYMEILRERLLGEELSGNSSRWYGTLEELIYDLEQKEIEFPCVIKKAEGSMSRGVFLAYNKEELLKNARKISFSADLKSLFWEKSRAFKHKGYLEESKYENKFIVQKFIPGLTNDWKVLVFGNHYYVLSRGIKQYDFRASGSHYNYKAGSESGITEEMLNMVKEIYQKLNIPHLSLDFAISNGKPVVHEFQAVYFGTSTISFSKDLFVFNGNSWDIIEAKLNQEEEYIHGLVHFINNHNL